MSVIRYSREVDLADLNNPHTLAVLAVPPGSRVLDLGAADGSVARVLQARGCAVMAVERDSDGVRALATDGIPFMQADLDTLDENALPRHGFDVVLLLDVVEHLVDPAALLTRVTSWLAPGGRVLISVPNVAHAAVRLSLLQGHFPRTDTGLLDRTHLHFFDRQQLDQLLTGAGLQPLDVLTVERAATETELSVSPEDVPAGVMEVIAADPLSRVYQFFVVAVPGAGSPLGGGLLQAMVSRLRNIEGAYRALEDHAFRTELDGTARLDATTSELRRVAEYVAHLERQVGGLETRLDAQGRERDSQLQSRERELEAARDELQALQAAAEAGREQVAAQLADLVADRDTLRRQLAQRMEELRDAHETVAALLRDVAVQREFAAALAVQLPGIGARGGEAPVLAEFDQYKDGVPTPAVALLASEVAEFRRLQGALAFRALARLDAISRRTPRLRAALRTVARRLAGVNR